MIERLFVLWQEVCGGQHAASPSESAPVPWPLVGRRPGEASVLTVSEQPDETFDEFCARLHVTADELPHAFAAWLGPNWDGRYERVDNQDDTETS